MHLKKLSLKGYKTYRDQTTIVDLHAGVNVFVGLNGSGKSNIFSAIRFALGGEGATNEQQRRALLYESQGHQAASAFVEITFDNSDGRIPVDKAEVVLRRSITIATDTYEWNGKSVQKAEVDSWLEGAGLSTKQNTYCIVERDKVVSLTSMSDGDRLDLLKEVSGAHIYDVRRGESLKVLENTRKKREHIAEVMEDIREKLERLDEDQQELKITRGLLREKVAIESVIADREKRQCKERVKELEAEASEILRELGGERAVLADISDNADKEKGELDELTKDLNETIRRLRFLAKRRENLSAEYAELSASCEGNKHTEEQNTASISVVKERLEEARAECVEVTNGLIEKREQLKALLEKQNSVRSELAALNGKREKLAAKRGSGPSYESVADRNEILKTKVDAKSKRLEEVEALLAKQMEQLERDEQEIGRLTDEIARLEAESEAHAEKNIGGDLIDAEKSIIDTQDAIREKSKEISALKEELESIVRERQELLEAVWRTAPPAVREGYTWLMESGIDGIHGLLIEHLDILEQYRLSAEVTGGLSLFNVLVDDDKVGEECLNFIREKQVEMGKPLRVTLTPLQQIEFSLTDLMGAALRHVLIPDLEIGSKLTSYKLDGVTEDGDTITWRGTMKGGFIDPGRYTRLRNWYRAEDLQLDIKRAEDRINQAEEELRQLRVTEAELVELLIELRRTAQSQLNAEAGRVRQVTEHREALSRLRNSSEMSSRLQREYNAEVEQLKLDISAIKSEMKTKKLASGALTTGETKQLEDAEASIKENAAQAAELTSQVTDLEDAIARLRARETSLLGTRIRVLQEQLKSLQFSRADVDVARMESGRRRQWLAGQLTDVEQEIALLEERQVELQETKTSKGKTVENLGAEVADLEKAILKLKESYEEKRNDIADYQERVNIADAKLDEIGAELSGSAERIEDETRKIGESTTVRELQRRLLECKAELDGHPLVNNKALEQFSQFDAQYKELLLSQEEMDSGQVAIDNLIAKLDGEKDNNIIKSFAQINEHFAATFKELVPNGSARMKLLKRDLVPEHVEMHQGREDEDEDHELGAADTVDEKYAGVSIEVTFSADQTRMRKMHELGGSQKTVVAVALLFAILRSEQPPLYLLDEVDAALDAQYREAFARLISSVTNPNPLAHRPPPPAQVICSTFRPELCSVADRGYEVSMDNRSSRIALLTDFDEYFARV
ncbi:hypothetical protein FOL47_008539 [Perkinsus chesapeaki]|uniref:SMC hinge domain-containing protein n=1 Tax=Perkinsus chesapeaki TaxID=330153 RepID=A0A7J6LE42_PERCH|nr:hypothetical protein FOL47_008539 [Perkinsus chesapeaki]